MYRPGRFSHLIHPETDAEGRIARPFRVGLRNCFAAMVPIGLGVIGYLIRYHRFAESTAWWAFPVVIIAVIAVAFGHAYLGAAIGGKRANNNFLIALMIVLFVGLWWLTKYLESKRG